MEKAERIRELMPLIDNIKDKKLREGVVKIWVRVWGESKFKDVADCPAFPGIEGCDAIQHTNCVTEVCVAMASIVRKIWGFPINDDLLLAAGLLHDIDKIVAEIPLKDGSVKPSPMGENLIHGSYGAYLVLSEGLPLPLAGLIATHTPEVHKTLKTDEGLILGYADMLAADIFHLRAGRGLTLQVIHDFAHAKGIGA